MSLASHYVIFSRECGAKVFWQAIRVLQQQLLNVWRML